MLQNLIVNTLVLLIFLCSALAMASEQEDFIEVTANMREIQSDSLSYVERYQIYLISRAKIDKIINSKSDLAFKLSTEELKINGMSLGDFYDQEKELAAKNSIQDNLVDYFESVLASLSVSEKYLILHWQYSQEYWSIIESMREELISHAGDNQKALASIYELYFDITDKQEYYNLLNSTDYFRMERKKHTDKILLLRLRGERESFLTNSLKTQLVDGTIRGSDKLLQEVAKYDKDTSIRSLTTKLEKLNPEHCSSPCGFAISSQYADSFNLLLSLLDNESKQKVVDWYLPYLYKVYLNELTNLDDRFIRPLIIDNMIELNLAHGLMNLDELGEHCEKYYNHPASTHSDTLYYSAVCLYKTKKTIPIDLRKELNKQPQHNLEFMALELAKPNAFISALQKGGVGTSTSRYEEFTNLSLTNDQVIDFIKIETNKPITTHALTLLTLPLTNDEVDDIYQSINSIP